MVILVVFLLAPAVFLVVGDGDDNNNDSSSEDSGLDGEGVDGLGVNNDLDAMELRNVDQPEAPPEITRACRIHSIAHEDIINRKVVYVHVDVEDGGPMCGLLQISAVILDADLNQIGQFNEFVKPPDNAIWNEVGANESHGYHKDHPSIVNAMPINLVWPRFCQFVERHINGEQVLMMLAWSGEGSDCSKIFHLTEVSQWRAQLDMPRGVKYFCDPKIAISDYKSCLLHEKKRGIEKPVGYGLGTVYHVAYGEPLDGAHDSMVDTLAQVRICKDPRVKDFIDKSKSVKLMEDVWKGKKKRKAEVEAEPTRPVPLGLCLLDGMMDPTLLGLHRQLQTTLAVAEVVLGARLVLVILPVCFYFLSHQICYKTCRKK